MWTSAPMPESHYYRWYVSMSNGRQIEFGEIALPARLILSCRRPE
jgi:hypothetical protein